MAPRRTPSADRAASRLPAPRPSAGLRADPGLVQGLACTDCGSNRMTRILLTLTDGTPVDFVSCQACEHRAWRSADGTLELDGVLQRTRRERGA